MSMEEVQMMLMEVAQMLMVVVHLKREEGPMMMVMVMKVVM